MEHYTACQKGVLDTRDLIYFISFISVFVLSTKLVLQSRKW
jgi:ABC-2 type transport system permease protein